MGELIRGLFAGPQGGLDLEALASIAHQRLAVVRGKSYFRGCFARFALRFGFHALVKCKLCANSLRNVRNNRNPLGSMDIGDQSRMPLRPLRTMGVYPIPESNYPN